LLTEHDPAVRGVGLGEAVRFRGKSIRRKIVALLLVPLASLTGLWGFATFLTGREASHLVHANTVVEKAGRPLENTVRALQDERRQTLLLLADPRTSEALPLLRRRRAVTDRVLSDVRDGARQKNVRDALRPEDEKQLDSVLNAVEGLEALRESVDQRTIDRAKAMEFYNRLIDPCYRFVTGLRTMENVSMDQQVRALAGISRAREMLSREDALVASSLIAGRITAAELRQVSDFVANRRLLYEINGEMLPSAERQRVVRYWESPDSEALRAAEKALLDAGPTDAPRTIDAQRWNAAARPVLDRLAADSAEMNDRFKDRAGPAGYSILIKAGVAGVLGFLALLASVFVSVRIGRELIRDLSRLRKDAHEVSGVRLPSVMRRLAAGEQVDVETEAPRLQYDRDEIGQVGQALNTLQRAAVEAAVKQADMRRGVSEVFVNLARRNQVLLHRQLTLLDAMERRTENTDELADLFRLDHLTTRMRRHAEGLVILSGAAPSRQWRKPVQLMDVVRAAVAEVEDYERIEVRRLPRLGVSGSAVADLTHLIAELLENAAVFSPPHTAVQVLGERVSNGFTLEIHDRGLGMAPDALLDANLRLAETPEFELSDTDRLGLFVVSRLAQRQNVRVSLQISPYGGTSALVFIPAELLTEAPDTQGDSPRGGRRVEKAIGGTRTPGRRPGGGKGRAESTPDRRAIGRPPALVPVPDSGVDPALLDGPVELEGPVGTMDFGNDPLLDPVLPGAAGPGDTGSGGVLRIRDSRRDDDLDQHQQAADRPGDAAAGARAERTGGRAPLPRRRPPALVAEHGRRVDEPGRAHPAPAEPGTPPQEADDADATAARRDPAGPRESTELAPPEPAPTGLEPVTPDPPRDTVGGLPRRIRQASLVPQLRDVTDGGTETAGTGPADAAATGTAPAGTTPAQDFERDADEVRRRMASLQRGWQRGRRQNAEDATGRGDTAQGTTPGGDGR